MNVITTEIKDCLIIEPKIFNDNRGFFLQTYKKDDYLASGIKHDFIQDNHSRSSINVLRGIHIQTEKPQGKLVSVIKGEVFDVAVDLRRDSNTFGKWTAVVLSEKNKKQFWVPPGFGHAFLSLTDDVDLVYKCTEYYYPEKELTIAWNDPKINIDWPCKNPILSDKDMNARSFNDIFK